MSRKVLTASVAILILASVADACFFKKRQRVYFAPVYADNYASTLTIQSVDTYTPVNNAISNLIPWNQDTTVKVYSSYYPGSDVMDLTLTDLGPYTPSSPRTAPKQRHYYNHTTDPVAEVYAGGYILTFTIPKGDLVATESYLVIVTDDTRSIPSNTVTFNTSN